MTAALPLDEPGARARDASDPLAAYAARFHFPAGPGGAAKLYFVGNSLGLQPREARALVDREMDDWAQLAVDAHFRSEVGWFAYHETLREPLARLVGAKPTEVVAMNSLTTNLHLMMVSFYRPTATRFRVIMEAPAFPSDVYAVETHLRARGIDPEAAVIRVGPREGETCIRDEDLDAAIEAAGATLALVLIGGVNFLTGQRFDLARVAAAAHGVGAMAGFDLAHAAGNVPVDLHDADADFACWCSYKYLNGGPGAIAGCFVHERHGRDVALPRFGGWWGNDPATRFRMQLEERFVARPDADGWQLSNPPILAMAPLRASLAIFDEAGIDAIRAKSVRLTGFLRDLLEARRPAWLEIATPSEPERRGAQLSLRVLDRPRERFAELERAGIVADFREPDVIRVAPAPLYVSYHDCWRLANLLAGG